MPKRTMTEKDLWNTIAYLEDRVVAMEMELEEAEKKLESYVTIRPTDVRDRYDLWDGSVQLLAGAQTETIGHLMLHGGACPMGCEYCPRPVR